MRTKINKKKNNGKLILIGLDLSINSPGFCVGKGNQYYCSSIQYSNNEKFPHRIMKYDKMTDRVLKRLKIKNPSKTIIMIEDYAQGAKGRTFEIAEMTGIFKWKLMKKYKIHPSNMHLCTIQHLKMFALTKGNAKKDLILKQVYKLWNFDTDINDEADAFILWRILKAMYLPNQKVTSYQRDILKRIVKYNET